MATLAHPRFHARVLARGPAGTRRATSRRLAPPRASADDDATGATARATAADASPFALNCPHFDACPGCTMSEGVHEPPTLSRARAFFADRGLPDFAARTGAVRGWRCRAKLAARSLPKPNGKPGAGPLALGLFARGTHDLVQIPECVVHHPSINRAAAAVVEAANRLGVKAYDETTGKGRLRYVQLTAVASDNAGRADLDPDAAVQIALVWNAPAPPESIWNARGDENGDEDGDGNGDGDGDASVPSVPAVPASVPVPADARALAESLARDSPPGLVHSVWINFNDAADNAIVGPGWAHVVGPRWHWSAHGAARVCYVPGSFMQSNVGAYDALLASLRDAVPPGSAVSELYAGAGAIGLSIAASDASVESVRCVESVAAAAETFAASASALPDAARAAATFVVARAEDAARDAVRDADVIIVDPPRKGLDARTLAALTGAAPDTTATGGGNQGASDPRVGMQGHAGGGRKKRNRRRRRAAKGGGEDASASASARVVEAVPPPPARLGTLVYVSCGFASFERDAEALLESGEWTLERAEGFNFFPGGDALEVLAVFRRTRDEVLVG
jgi:tRNA/tmRNA/rRNA uracil-C5-methylase (TrmA/RlmC/RlmD family)